MMYNRKLYTIGLIVSSSIIAVVLFIIFLIGSKENKTVDEAKIDELIESSSKSVKDDEAQNVVKDNVNLNEFEVIENKTESKKEEDKVIEKKNETKNTSIEEKKNNDGNLEKKVENVKQVFNFPVEGEVLNGYAKDNLIYSATLDEWITHCGIDFKADATTIVKAASDGVIKSIKNDPRYGLTVIIEHPNGFKTVYANLLTAEFVKIGEKVTTGQTIGTVGNTASFEILDESHLHLEMLKDEEYVDPSIYLKK